MKKYVSLCSIIIFILIFSNVVDEWVSYALTPNGDAQKSASHWMKLYFSMCDQSPNSRFTKVNEDFKKEVYQRYVAEVTDLDPSVRLIDENAFIKLWARVYPYCVKRSHCSIPGKCKVCEKIDELRRCCENRSTMLRLQEAHMLHRGGLFMLERAKYV